MLIQLLASKDFEVCMRAADELGAIGQPAIDPLIKALASPHTGFGAMEALSRIGNPAVGALIDLLKDPQMDAFAAGVLGKMGVKAVPALIETLIVSDDSLRFWAASVLGWIGDRRAVEPLTELLHDEDPEVRGSATKALKEIDAHE